MLHAEAQSGGCAGSVLVPVDTAGRLLEILLLLASLWESAGMKQPLVLLSHVALTVLELARSQLEWLAEGLSKSLASAHGTGNPFACRSWPCCACRHATIQSAGTQEYTEAALRPPTALIQFVQSICTLQIQAAGLPAYAIALF